MEKESFKDKKTVMRPEYNIESCIIQKMKDMNLKGRWEWVKSHTELQTTPHNRVADKLADNAHNLTTTLIESSKSPHPQIWYKNHEITNFKVRTMIQKLCMERIETELTKRGVSAINKRAFLNLAIGERNDRINHGQGRFIRKMIWGVLPVREKEYASKNNKDNQCPRCNSATETLNHMIQCGYNNIPECKMCLDKEMKEIDTAPEIQTRINKLFSAKEGERISGVHNNNNK